MPWLMLLQWLTHLNAFLGGQFLYWDSRVYNLKAGRRHSTSPQYEFRGVRVHNNFIREILLASCLEDETYPKLQWDTIHVS